MLKLPFEKILITGATGSFGKFFIFNLLKNHPEIKKIVIYSRDELKQWELSQIYPKDKYPQLRFFIGDIRDYQRLKYALDGIEAVVHAAALKQVCAAEYNPIEFIKTNVLGAENIVKACCDCNVKYVVALSTDKAAAPINLYGATKLCSDKLLIAANNITGSRDLRFSVVRYGNVMGSRGSVIPFFIEKAKSKKKVLPITSKDMTRFNISLQDGVEMVIWALKNAIGGEIFVPKIPSYRIIDVAEAIGPNCIKKYIGIRPGEKIHEEMITRSDSFATIDIGKYYAILPSDFSIHTIYEKNGVPFERLAEDFSYNSGSNIDFLSVNQIRELIKLHVDNKFVPV